jgi:hypothetical protein
MQRTKHAQQIADRFRDLVTSAGHSLADEHYEELALLIEAGIDTALVEKLEGIADQLQKMAKSVRQDADQFRG